MRKNIFILDDDYKCFQTIKKVLKFYFPDSNIYPTLEQYETAIINTENRDYKSLLSSIKNFDINLYIIDIKFGNENNALGIEFLEYLEKNIPYNENKYDYILITDGGYEQNNLKKYSKDIPFISKSNLGNRATALAIKQEMLQLIK